MGYFTDNPTALIERWITADGTVLAYGHAPAGADSELSNGDSTYAHTYAERPGYPDQGDAALPGRVDEPGVHRRQIHDVTIIVDFPAFVEVTGYTRSVDEYAQEVYDHYAPWTDGHHYYGEVNDAELFEFSLYDPTRDRIESFL